MAGNFVRINTYSPETTSLKKSQKLLLQTGAVIAGLALLVFLVWLIGNQLYFKNNRLTLKKIQVAEFTVAEDRADQLDWEKPLGTPHFPPEKVQELLRQCQVTQGTANLLCLNLKAIRQHFLQIPSIEDVAVLRLYPDTLRIAIRERKPLAVTVLKGKYYCYVDKEGVLFPVEDQLELSKHPLPQVHKIPGLEKMPQGVSIPDEGIQSIIAMCKAHNSRTRKPSLGYDIISVTYDGVHHLLSCYLRPAADNKTLQAKKEGLRETPPTAVLSSDVNRMEESFYRLDSIIHEKASSSGIIHLVNVSPEENPFTRP